MGPREETMQCPAEEKTEEKLWTPIMAISVRETSPKAVPPTPITANCLKRKKICADEKAAFQPLGGRKSSRRNGAEKQAHHAPDSLGLQRLDGASNELD